MLCDDKVRVEGAKSAKRLCSLKHRATSRAESDCAIFIRFRWLDPGEADSEDAGRSKINRDDTNPGVRESGSSRTCERRPLQPGRRSERFTGKIRRPEEKTRAIAPRGESPRIGRRARIERRIDTNPRQNLATFGNGERKLVQSLAASWAVLHSRHGVHHGDARLFFNSFGKVRRPANEVVASAFRTPAGG